MGDVFRDLLWSPSRNDALLTTRTDGSRLPLGRLAHQLERFFASRSRVGLLSHENSISHLKILSSVLTAYIHWPYQSSVLAG